VGLPLLVIPAQAGIQTHKHINIDYLLDSRLRGNDEIGLAKANHEHGVFIRRKSPASFGFRACLPKAGWIVNEGKTG
jgi:hypothetical protein